MQTARHFTLSLFECFLFQMIVYDRRRCSFASQSKFPRNSLSTLYQYKQKNLCLGSTQNIVYSPVQGWMPMIGNKLKTSIMGCIKNVLNGFCTAHSSVLLVKILKIFSVLLRNFFFASIE